jgi:hypothetical protein
VSTKPKREEASWERIGPNERTKIVFKEDFPASR